MEAQSIAADIAHRVETGNKPPDICILCKQLPANYAPAIIEALEHHGIQSRIETDYQDLIKEPIVNLVLKFILCSLNRKRPHDWEFVEESLLDIWGIGAMHQDRGYEQMQESIFSKADELSTQMPQCVDWERFHTAINGLVEFFDINKIKAKFPAYRQGDFLEKLLGKFELLFWDNLQLTNGDWQLAVVLHVEPS